MVFGGAAWPLMGLLMLLTNLHCLSPVGDWTGLDCDSSQPCKEGYECYALTKTCVEVLNVSVGPGSCVQQSDCEYADPGKLDGHCNLEGHYCVGCLVDAHCFGVCHPTAFQCLNCLEDSDCGPEKRCDLDYHECTDQPLPRLEGS